MFKAISPLDGRYAEKLSALGDYFSEFALMRMRVTVELRFLKALEATGLFPGFIAAERDRIDAAEADFDENDYQRIKEIEQRLNHDVKSCEVFLIEKLQLTRPNMIHFGLTSEDVNNLAYTFLFKEYLEQVQLPQLKSLLELLIDQTGRWKQVPFPARTHGQMASPSTAGKEIAVYLSRLSRQYGHLKNFKFSGKLNGATGNFSALLAAFPDYDWLAFSKDFMEKHGLAANLVTTQIEDHDNWAAYLNICKQIDHILLDMDRDMWLYLTLGYFALSTDPGAVGSSTMPHKVNPINFENSEGNLQLAAALINGLVDKLGNSRLQRDLSDSTVSRNIGVALGHGYLALQETMKGLQRLQINEARCRAELKRHPELLAEPVQTILRREGLKDPYNLLKEFTRGRVITPDDLKRFIDGLQVPAAVKQELKALKVEEYLGAAQQVCQLAVEQAREIMA